MRLWQNMMKRRRAIAQIRRHFAELGHPLDHLTDDQIEIAIESLNSRLSELALSIQRAGAAINRLRKLLREDL